MGGFSNPVTNAAGQLVRNVMKSINYVAGLTGWQISKNGDAEFNLGTFRGSISITGSNGSRIVIDASQPYPTMFFYSKDGTNYSQLSLINAISNSAADFWISSGQWSPAIDSIPRAIRLYMSGAQNDHARFSVDRVSDGGGMGGRVSVHVDKVLLGYRNDSVVPAQTNELIFDNNNDGTVNVKRHFIVNVPTQQGHMSVWTNTNGGLWVDGNRITGGVQADNLISCFAGSQATPGPDIMPGMLNWMSFEKKYANSRLIATMFGTFYSTGSSSGGSFGLNVGGISNTYIAKLEQTNPSLGNHVHYGGVGQLSGTIPAGLYNISPIWGRTTGVGTLNVDGNDTLSWSVTEVG